MTDNYAIWGAITSLRHLLAGAYESTLLECENPREDLKLARERFLGELEPGIVKNVDNEDKVIVLHHATSFMEEFWADMEKQVSHQLEP